MIAVEQKNKEVKFSFHTCAPLLLYLVANGGEEWDAVSVEVWKVWHVGGERSTGERLKAKDAVPPKSSGPKRVPAPLMGRQKPPRAQEGLACPTSPRRPIRPVRRQKLRARGRVERDRFFLSLYSQGNHHSINFVVTHLSIKTAPYPSKKKASFESWQVQNP